MADTPHTAPIERPLQPPTPRPRAGGATQPDGDARPPRPASRWRLTHLLEAPHRLAFAAAVAVLGGSALWWAAVLLTAPFGVAWPWRVPPGIAHGLLMGFGFMPLFFAGFLFTAGPRWLARPPVEARALRVAVGASLLGWALFAVGAHADGALAAGGLALAAGGFGNTTWRFAALLRASRVDDRSHARLVLAGCGLGVLLMISAACGLAWGRWDVARAALHAALWACLALVFVSVIHRMLPFFGTAAAAWLEAWPMALLWVMVGAVALQAPLAAADAVGVDWPPAAWLARAALDAACASVLLWLAWRWSRVQRLTIRMIAMLHLGFVWLGVAFALLAVSHGLAAFSDGRLGLGLAPLHALTAGFFGSLMFAMAGRVSAGHGGRPVAADDVLWRLFWVLQAAVVTRLVAALWPAGAGVVMPLAALLWAAGAGGWALRYGRWYGRPAGS